MRCGVKKKRKHGRHGRKDFDLNAIMGKEEQVNGTEMNNNRIRK